MKSAVQAAVGLNIACVHRFVVDGKHQAAEAMRQSYRAARTAQAPTGVDSLIETLPSFNIEDVLGDSRPVISLKIQRYEDGMMPRYDAEALLALLVQRNPKTVLEIGTFMGHSTLAMACNLTGAVIHTVDLPPDFQTSGNDPGTPPKDDLHLIGKRQVGREFLGKTLPSRIVQHFKDTALWDFAEAGHPEFIFIDGSHTYDYVKNDTQKTLALCKGGEYMLWHDCDTLHPGVVKFLREWREAGRDVVRISGTCLAFWKVTGR